ncbi:DNA adenine methylase [Gloeobacter kilaueensis]|uniref:D12 class N6 adenine-specific DNA methyltransferase n=1 Tax=Gloeobacter kilaueensis (strain ATCC BAA-2537 / CCAP 1431/1 / ULC 316 / JS1) TaxID=1183438 RepID=U5QDU3_GLOK1|nr:DNA adenine methylase [Gloeobacter kilaueensis]AGY57127.1 D12 class N6 adenine-specific DNA methyltransferase [Gloeobacter kilaueensis JS1]
MITRPALRWYGSKWRLARWIISHMPPHTRYVEPFAGSLAVLLQKPPVRCEVVSDLDEEVCNFFAVLRDQFVELIRVIRLTPYHRLEFERAWLSVPAADPIERARRFYVRSWQGQSGPTGKYMPGWRSNPDGKRSVDPVRDFLNDSHLMAVARRLRLVHWETRPAIETIQRWGGANQTLIYCDPPYLGNRKANDEYAHTMSEADHIRLFEQLEMMDATAIVSHAPCPLYDELYASWTRFGKAAQTRAGKPSLECIWISPAATAAAGGLLKLEVGR